jgi:hypothetical protein
MRGIEHRLLTDPMYKQIISICALSIILIFFFVELQGQIGFDKSKQYKNKNIPRDVENTMIQTDKKIIDAIKTDRIDEVKRMCNKELISTLGESKLDSLLILMKKHLSNCDLEYKDQFYVENTAENSSNIIFSGFSSDYDYSITYQPTDKKVFISLIVPKDLLNKFLLTLIYGSDMEGLKLNVIKLGQFSAYNKTAIDYYKQAKDDFDNGNLIDAGCDLFFGRKCLRPAAQFMQYLKEKDFIELEKKVLSRINSSYTFPLVIEQITTQPKILNVVPKYENSGWYLMITYFSRVPIQDSVNLKMENQKIQKIIGTVFKGIDKNKSYIYYIAMNEMPDGSDKKIDQFGFLQKLDK